MFKVVLRHLKKIVVTKYSFNSNNYGTKFTDLKLYKSCRQRSFVSLFEVSAQINMVILEQIRTAIIKGYRGIWYIGGVEGG